MKKTLSIFLSLFLFGLVVSPVAMAEDPTDTDGDGYFGCATEPCDEDLPFGAKGWEPAKCDAITIDDKSIVGSGGSVAGSKVYPGAVEPPNSKIDYNCDGEAEGFVPGAQETDKDLFGVIGDIITLIGKIAVFVSAGALIYGGIMFATASGEEMKIQKAKKTIIGAVVGLIVGLLAWNIVGFVTDWVG